MVKTIKKILNKISKVIFVENKKEVNVTKEFNKAVNGNFYNNLNGMI